MFVLLVAVSFVLVCICAWLLLFPSAREACARALGRLFRRGSAAAAAQRERARTRGGRTAEDVRARVGGVQAWLGRHRVAIAATVLILALPPLLVLQLRERPQLDSFDDAAVDTGDSQVLALLRGERLVPPPELPPEVFIAAEAALTQMAPTAVAPERIVTADRRWGRIDPAFQQRVLAVYRIMQDQYGIEMALVEGYRSPERQAELARGGKATRAGAGMSCHQYGLAVDSAPLRNGKLQWDMADPWTRDAYFLYGRLAQEAGLEWGGNWRSLKDYVHLESKAACRASIRMARAG
ncbi:M15 family metallopeptidase [Cognatilysobacter bugurensis]|uniref:D-alanyl-D-alanine carboxypeptidase n=1 Tax=Cognatilysobacter bugurensis TaxID=543356 RepID=A0A918W8R8_9GAMM|nr:M15 family metallopeptidase [Lysobacter bugurensis]GHA82108.1 D-alanyl-D-alanine carboxypeptidase [Lysobacter bugurensis]